MSLISLCGVPGSGKTLDSTYFALKHYNKQNILIKYYLHKFLYRIPKLKDFSRYQYFNKFPKHRINNVYSNYPILLDKKYKIYSNVVSLWDLNNDYSFEPGSIIIIDEVQLYADSDEYKDKIMNAKLSRIAKFLQAHRHYGIDTIIFTSQNPSRIFKKARNICESYRKQEKLINIPFTPYTIMRSTDYYDLDFYGRFVPRDRKERKKLPFDYKKHFCIFNRKKVFKAYNSRYLQKYNYNKPLLTIGTYNSKIVPYERLKELFD